MRVAVFDEPLEKPEVEIYNYSSNSKKLSFKDDPEYLKCVETFLEGILLEVKKLMARPN